MMIKVGDLHSFAVRHRGGSHSNDALAFRNVSTPLTDVVEEVPVGLVQDEQIVHGQLICNRLCVLHRLDLNTVEKKIQLLIDLSVGIVKDFRAEGNIDLLRWFLYPLKKSCNCTDHSGLTLSRRD
jgi:hypothetical protein